MKAIAAADALFLYTETPEQHQHMMGLLVLDPSTSPEPFSVDDLMQRGQSMVEETRPYRQRLYPSPLAMSGPILQDDPDFDIENHMHHIALPPPGSDEQLAEITAKIAGQQLDRSRPLWENWYVSGLEGDRVAMITKTHHCLLDGVSGAETMMKLFDLTPDAARDDTELPEATRTSRAPSRFELLKAGVRGYQQRTNAYTLTSKTLRSLYAKRRARRNSDSAAALPPGMTSLPRLRFNGQITRHRSVAFGSLALDDIKRLKNHFEVKLNDAVLAICTIALQRYLAHHDALPDEPIACTVPVSLSLKHEGEEDSLDEGENQVAMMDVKLPLDLRDPAEIITAVGVNSRAAKEVFDQSYEGLITNTISALPPQLAEAGMRLASGAPVGRFPISNVAISNIPGSPLPLYIAGAQVVANYPLGPVPNGVGLNITLMSYHDRLDFGVQACQTKVPDPWLLAGFIEESIDDLLALLPRSGGKAKKRKQPARRKSRKTGRKSTR